VSGISFSISDEQRDFAALAHEFAEHTRLRVGVANRNKLEPGAATDRGIASEITGRGFMPFERAIS